MAYYSTLEKKLKDHLDKTREGNYTEVDILDAMSVILDKIGLDKRMDGFRVIAEIYRNSASQLEKCARDIEDVNR